MKLNFSEVVLVIRDDGTHFVCDIKWMLHTRFDRSLVNSFYESSPKMYGKTFIDTYVNDGRMIKTIHSNNKTL